MTLTNGLYRFTDAAGNMLPESAIDIPAKKFSFDLAEHKSKSALFGLFADRLKWPEDFGQNWDAFADLMMDAEYWPKSKNIFLLLNGLAKHPLEKNLRTILDDVADFWQDESQAFFVLTNCSDLPQWHT